MPPFEREHRNARRKERDFEMYEGVREVMSKHGAKTSCFFTSKRKAVLLFAISAQKKLNPLEPARTKALNGNRMLATFFSLSVKTIRSVRSFSWTITWNLRFLKCVINSV